MTIVDINSMDKDILCQYDTFIAMFSIDSPFEREQVRQAARERAVALKITKKFDSLLKAFEKEFERKQASSGEKAITYKDQSYDIGSWMLINGGIASYSDRYGYVYACNHKIIIVKRLKNLESKKEKVILAFDRDRWEEITVAKEVIASSTKIVALSSYGVQVTSENAKPLVRYLSEMESCNEISLCHSTSKYGWHGEDFIPFDKRIVFDADSQFKPLNDSLEPKGSYQAWLGLVGEMRKYTPVHYETQLLMAGSVASVLVRLTSALPFILNLWGGTGGGKTVAMMIAASIWADPGEGRFMTDALSTQNAFEVREDILNDLPLIIDDFSKVSKKFKDDFTELIYMIASGKGKSRSNVDLGLNPMKTWLNACLSNMERPLIGDNLKGGEVNRVLDFEMEDGRIFGDNGVHFTGNYVAEMVKGNYGYAGREIIRIIKETGRENIKKMMDSAYKKIKEEGKKKERKIEDKQALSFALVLVGDQILEKLFNDGIFLDMEKCIAQLKTADDVQETERVYQYIMDAVEQNIKKFDDDENYHGEIWGFIEDDYVYIIPKVFNKIAEEGNFSGKAFCQWAKREGLLKFTENKLQTVARRNSKEPSRRYYAIFMNKEETDENGFMKTNGFDPFSEV